MKSKPTPKTRLLHQPANLPESKRASPPLDIQPKQPGFYRAADAADLLGIGVSTWWLWNQNGAVRGVATPRAIRLSPGVTVWQREAVHLFCEQLAALDDATPPEAA